MTNLAAMQWEAARQQAKNCRRHVPCEAELHVEALAWWAFIWHQEELYW